MSQTQPAATAAKSDAATPAIRVPEIYLATDRPDVPLGTEVNSDAAWTEFQMLSSQSMQAFTGGPADDEEDFGDTGGNASSENPSFEPTAFLDALDMELPADHDEQHRDSDIDAVIALTEQANRAYPKPQDWLMLYQLLRLERDSASQHFPPPPPIEGAAWLATSAVTKKMCLLSHIEWAANNGVLQLVEAFLRELPEDRWLHIDR
jgi:hypothetical protein